MAIIVKGYNLKNYEEQERRLKSGLKSLDSEWEKRLIYAKQHNLEDVNNEISGLIKCGSTLTYKQPWKDDPAHVFIRPTNNGVITEINIPKEAKGIFYETIVEEPQLCFFDKDFTFYITGLTK